MRGACEVGEGGGGEGSNRSGGVGVGGGCGPERIVGGWRKVVVLVKADHSPRESNPGGVLASSWRKVKGVSLIDELMEILSLSSHSNGGKMKKCYAHDYMFSDLLKNNNRLFFASNESETEVSTVK